MCFYVNLVFLWENMFMIWEGYFRDFFYLSLNEVFKFNIYSVIKFFKIGKVCDFINCIYVWSVNGYLVLEMFYWFFVVF